MSQISAREKDAEKDGYHFALIQRAIEAIDKIEIEEKALSLTALSDELKMQPTYFQKIFTRYVGVSPQRYQQFLRLSHAKELLRTRMTTLETAEAVGLSGGGRLYDLFLRWECMTPGAFARGAEGMEIFYGWVNSPFGTALVMANSKGICGMAFSAEFGRERVLTNMQSRWPKAHYIRDDARMGALSDPAFSGKGTVEMCLMGAPFQIKVWEALLAIPSGFVTTYSTIAKTIKAPKAVRAVGTAVGRNPISFLIPCHRVLRKSGGLGGYHWGLSLKRAMLADESAAFESNAPRVSGG